MCQVIREAIDAVLSEINNQLLAKYVLTRYLLMYLVRRVLDAEEFGCEVVRNPRVYVLNSVMRDKFRKLMTEIFHDIVTDLNSEVDEYGEDFDYRGRLRDDGWVKELTKDLVAMRKKLVRRGTIRGMAAEWQAL